VHLSGVAGFWLAAYLDRPNITVGTYVAANFGAMVGLITLVLCPATALWLSTGGRLTPRDAAALVNLTCLGELLELLAMLPLVQ
jgi:hypothetical protein